MSLLPPGRFTALTLATFDAALAQFAFTRQITSVHLHHTWRPTRAEWRGEASIHAMRDYHVQTNGWADIAQHVTVAPDGSIWTGRDWNREPASATGFNGTLAAGPFMIETVGNFDVGRDPFDGVQRAAVLGVIVHVQRRFHLPVESLKFHRQLNSPKTCPGTGIDYATTLAAVRAEHARLTAGGPAGVLA